MKGRPIGTRTADPYNQDVMTAKHRSPAARLASKAKAGLFPALVFITLGAFPTEAEAEARKGRKQPIPVVKPEEKAGSPAATQSAASDPNSLFEEIEFGNTLVIEGKVEKPQVQFTLLKEPPPEKEIRFETSFLQNILKQDRENTFDAAKRYGKE